MKKIMRYIPVVLATVVLASACQKEVDPVAPKDNGPVHFTVTANGVQAIDSETKTAMVDDGTNNPYVKWLSSDAIRVWEYVDGAKKNYFSSNETTLSNNDEIATFDLTLYGNADGDEYVYTAIYPATGVTYQETFCYFVMPSEQTLVNGNFAANADVLIGNPIVKQNRISELENLSFQFKRPGTVAKLTLKGITAGEEIINAKITAPTGQKIAGRCKVNLETGEVTDKAYYGETNEITLLCGNIVATGTDVFFFRCLDGTWKSGNEVSITVETNVATYTKTVALPKDYVFADGGLTKFGFQGMTRAPKEAPVYKAGTDKFTSADFAASNTTYTGFSGVSKTTNAVYAGNSAKNANGSIQLRSSNSNSGIVTTQTTGYAQSVSVTWNSATQAGRVLEVYGKNTPYSSASDLYGDNRGTKLGEIEYGTSSSLTIDGSYTYIGIRSSNNALMLDDVSFVWGTEAPSTICANPIISYNNPTVTISCATFGATIHYTLDGSDPTSTSPTYSEPFDLDASKTVKAIAIKDGFDDSEIVSLECAYSEPATISCDGTLTLTKAEADGTINVTYTGAEDYDLKVYSDAAHNTEAGNDFWFVADFDSNYNIEWVADANTGAARNAYIVIDVSNSAAEITSKEIVVSQAAGAASTWTYEVTSSSPTFASSAPVTVNGATWSIVMGDLNGSPTANGSIGTYSSTKGWKWGDSSSKYWSSYTLSTDYFKDKKVSKVTVNFLNNGSKTGTMVVTQGEITIGTASDTFGQVWTDLSVSTNQGDGGTLSIQYSVAQASLIHSITVEYYD